MKRRTFIKETGAGGLIAFISPANIVPAFPEHTGSGLEETFIHPPVSAYPQNYWFWMNGNVTKEGITLDLEAMKRVGIGGVFNFDVGTGIPKGPVEYLSEEWLQLKKHAIREAERLGLEFTMHNCPGFSASGGPWITPELAMQQLTWSETYVAGDKEIKLSLSKPPSRLNYYRDVAVLAFPSLAGEHLLQTISITSSSGKIDIKQLNGEEQQGVIVQPSLDDPSAWLRFEFDEPYEARGITFYISTISTDAKARKPLEVGERTSVMLQASDDGIHFRLITEINTGLEIDLSSGYKYIVYDIPSTKAKYFRLSSAKTRRYKQVQFSGITRLQNWMEKTNQRARNIMHVEEASGIIKNNNQFVPAGSIVDLNAVLDVTTHLGKDGLLNWNAPVGNWTIVRIGFTPTGKLNSAAPDTGIGLECDKYSETAITFHYKKMIADFLPVLRSLASKGKVGLEIDSYEAGMQNWTPGFEQEFKKRCGYDITKYLPALTGGRILGSIDITERFLWDFRRVQADLIAENYYGRFHQLCQEHGITSYIEPYELGPFEEMQIGSEADINLGEFWNGISTTLPVKQPVLRTPKLAASIAHINGQKVVGAEAFTAEPESARWQEYPFAMKAVGDKAFTKGINRMIIHRFAHQPHPTALPGMTMGPWGIHFDRTNTWWDQSKAWLNYLARCQSLLQQGLFVADLAYFTGEDANMYTNVNPDQLNPPPPQGYDYDLVNAEVILKNVKIVNQQLLLSNGMSYRILVLQDYKAVTLTLIRKLRTLLNDGMIMVGAKPERSPGLIDYADGDAEFKSIVNELWGNIDGNTITENSFGKGRIFWGRSLQSILQTLNVTPDFQFSSRSGGAPIIYTHRKTREADIYFLSNQRRTCEDVVCTFRVNNKQPELWDATTGKIIPVAIYEIKDNSVRLPVQFEPYASVFVVFRSPASKDGLHSLEKDNITVLSTKGFPPLPGKLYENTTNNFTIIFWAKPEINILLNPDLDKRSIHRAWTQYYAIYPPLGDELYGEGHATCGITVGRNGVAVWENATGGPVLVLSVPISISGWSQIALVYHNGAPSVYVNGKLAGEGRKSNNIVHPSVDSSTLNEDVSYYNGDMSEPVLFAEVLSHDQLLQLVAEGPTLKVSPFVVQMAAGSKPTLLVKQNGYYILRNSSGKTSSFQVSNVDKPLRIEGSWQVNFPPGLGAPAQIILPRLVSLHKHTEDGVKYFSGNATYTKNFTVSKEWLVAGRRWFLDLGRVEVIATVNVNGKDCGTLWKRPYSVDITTTLIPGINKLEIKITTLWPNRLIGDEQLADPDNFTPGGGSDGVDSLIKGGIEKLPGWYITGRPKPVDGRVSFTTWKHYTKNSPLLESGLIGPVVLQPVAVIVL
ncbi:MAG: glycoside hydrolase family protein [Segetibacter sp.]|nr:glycoside hydrolase family protein [Segetibacter sp.]